MYIKYNLFIRVENKLIHYEIIKYCFNNKQKYVIAEERKLSSKSNLVKNYLIQSCSCYLNIQF